MCVSPAKFVEAARETKLANQSGLDLTTFFEGLLAFGCTRSGDKLVLDTDKEGSAIIRTQSPGSVQAPFLTGFFFHLRPREVELTAQAFLCQCRKRLPLLATSNGWTLPSTGFPSVSGSPPSGSNSTGSGEVTSFGFNTDSIIVLAIVGKGYSNTT